jgi:hypothetical protein
MTYFYTWGSSTIVRSEEGMEKRCQRSEEKVKLTLKTE